MSSSPSSHVEMEELIAADALDGLDPDGRQELARKMAEHGPECQECGRLQTEYEEVAGYLAVSLEPQPLSLGTEEAVMHAARSVRPAGPSLRPGGRIRRSLAPVAVAAALALIAGMVGYSLVGPADSRQSRFIAFISGPGTEVVPFPSRDGQQLAVAFRPGQREGWVFGTNLPEPAGGRVYELWFRSRGSDRMQPAGTFVPSDGIVLEPATLGATVDLLAVSIEPPGGSPQPTTDPIFLAEV